MKKSVVHREHLIFQNISLTGMERIVLNSSSMKEGVKLKICTEEHSLSPGQQRRYRLSFEMKLT
jgi:hypothetical protein